MARSTLRPARGPKTRAAACHAKTTRTRAALATGALNRARLEKRRIAPGPLVPERPYRLYLWFRRSLQAWSFVSRRGMTLPGHPKGWTPNEGVWCPGFSLRLDIRHQNLVLQSGPR